MIRETRVELRIKGKDEKLLKTIYNSIEPDNKTLPPGMDIKTRCETDKIIIRIIDEKGDIMRIKNTIEDIIDSVDIVINALKGSK